MILFNIGMYAAKKRYNTSQRLLTDMKSRRDKYTQKLIIFGQAYHFILRLETLLHNISIGLEMQIGVWTYF